MEIIFIYIFTFAIFLYSIIFHEIAHGVVAKWFGDNTAEYSGRLTLNPLPHIDPFMSILLPLILFVSGSPFLFGGAKGVPVNFQALRHRKIGQFCVSIAGILTNILIAIFFAILLKYIAVNEFSAKIFLSAIVTNISLAVFNILPIPPLDGSKVLTSFLPTAISDTIMAYEGFGFILIILLLNTSLFHNILNYLSSIVFTLLGL